jgi:hypothetical protein
MSRMRQAVSLVYTCVRVASKLDLMNWPKTRENTIAGCELNTDIEA